VLLPVRVGWDGAFLLGGAKPKMKYLQTIQLTNPLLVALHEGRLKLQTGQWIKVSPNGKASRFVRATRHCIHAVHPNGPANSGRVQTARFKAALAK